MKCFFALTLAVSLAIAFSDISQPQQKPYSFQQGLTYVYDYRGRLASGLPHLANHYSAFELVCDVVIQPLDSNVVAMKLANIRIGRHNGPTPNDYQHEIVMEHQHDALYDHELSKPIRFELFEGKIKAFEAESSEAEWSLNIKKSILSLFNLNLTPKKIIKSTEQAQINAVPRSDSELIVYPIYEEGIGGICETVYEINNLPTNEIEQPMSLNVTKTRNYHNCLTEPIIEKDSFDVRGCPRVCRKERSFPVTPGYNPSPDSLNDPYMVGCPCGKEPHESPVESYNFVKYNISLEQREQPLIEGIYSEGKVTFSSAVNEILVVVHQNLTLRQVGNSQSYQIKQLQQPQQHKELAFRLPLPQSQQQQQQQSQQQGLKLDIPYYSLFGEQNVDELTSQVVDLLEKLAAELENGDISNSQHIMQKPVQIVNALAVLPKQALDNIFQQVHSTKSTRGQVKRKLFLDALAHAGSNDAALYCKEIIEQRKVTVWEAKEIVETIPQNMFLADVATIEAYLDLFQSQQIQQERHLAASTGIAFGKMVKESCLKRLYTPGDLPNKDAKSKHSQQEQELMDRADPQQSPKPTAQQYSPFSDRMKRSAQWESVYTQQLCTEQDIEKWTQIVARLLKEADTFHKKVTLIETLAHMGVPQSLQILSPYVDGSIEPENCPGYHMDRPEQHTEECYFVRQVATYALSHITEYYPKQVLPVVQKVFNNKEEPYEIRIAAFTTLVFADPEKHVLETIASQMHKETNRQVQSFVHSSLRTIGNFSLPCFEKMSVNSAKAFQHAPKHQHGYHYSKMVGKDYYDEKRDFGLYTLAEWVANNKSRVPRAGYFSVGQSNGPFQDELVQIGFNTKGIESLIERLVEHNGILSGLLDRMNPQQQQSGKQISKRSIQNIKQLMQDVKEQLNIVPRTDDEPKGTLFFKMFDRTSYYPIDKEYIDHLVRQAEDNLKEIIPSLLRGVDYHYVKLMMPSQLYKVVPSELGLPIVITHRHPMIVSLKWNNAKLRLQTSPNKIAPLGVNLTATVQPSVYYSSYTFVYAINPVDRQAFGSHVDKTTHLTFPAEVSVAYVKPKNLFSWSVTPKLPQQVIYHKTQAKTFVTKANLVEKNYRDWLQDTPVVQKMQAPFHWEKRVGHEKLGLGLNVQFDSENVWADKPFYLSEIAKKHGIIAALVEVFRNPSLSPREMNVQLEPDQHYPVYRYEATLQYKRITDEEKGPDSDDSDESSESNESDSDQSDESSQSVSSKSKSASSKSSQSSEESNESLKKIKAQRVKRSLRKEIVESSDESSNESGSKSFSKSGSKESSQSSSSESVSSQEKHKNHQHNKLSSSQSKDSSESSQSNSFEDGIPAYKSAMKAMNEKTRQTKKAVQQVIERTKQYWKPQQQQQQQTPVTIAHNLDWTLTARGPNPTYYAANILFVHTYDHRTLWLKTQALVKSPNSDRSETQAVCTESVVSYPVIPSEFYYNPTVMQSQKAKIHSEMKWGQKCQNEGIVVNGWMEKTEEKVITNYPSQSVQDLRQQEWYKKQCQKDMHEGKPLSFACERAIVDDSYFNQVTLEVKYKNIPKPVINMTKKLDLALKVGLYQHLDYNNLDVHNERDQIKFVAQYSSSIANAPLVNLLIRKPTENTHYRKVYTPKLRPFSSLMKIGQVYQSLVTKDEDYFTCNLMEEYVRTFDNVTVRFPEDRCRYLLAKDCSPKELFAIYAWQLDTHTKTKTVVVNVAKWAIKLTPPTTHEVFPVEVDGQTHEVTVDKPLTIKDDVRIYVRQTPSNDAPIVVIQAHKEKLQVLYDGKNAKVTVGGRYQGKTCGLCGDNNDESDEEFEGPDKCIYETAEDFVKSYALTGPQCESVPRPTGPKHCPLEYQPLSFEQQQSRRQQQQQRQRQQQQKSQQQIREERQQARQGSLFGSNFQTQRPVERTQYIQRGEMICFTTKPVPTCVDGTKPASTKQVQVGLHCLNQQSRFTQQLIEESQQKVIKQLANKRVDIRQTVTVPISCMA